MADSTVTFEIGSCIRGYDAYGTIWTPTLGEHISCERVIVNAEDSYAAAVMLRSTFVVQPLWILPVRDTFPCLLSRRPLWIGMKSSTGTWAVRYV